MSVRSISIFQEETKLCCYPTGTTLTVASNYRKKVKLLILWTMGTVITIIAFTHFAHVLTHWSTQVASKVFHVVYNKAIAFEDCPVGSFMYCPGNKKCISYTQRCDRYQDCPDDTDEINCECLPNEFTCKEGRCISNEFVCDRTRDCPLGDDENELTCTPCGPDQFRCSGAQQKCLSSSLVCDGKKHCYSGEDEDNCVFLQKKDELRVKTSMQTTASVCYEGWNESFAYYFCLKASKSPPIESYPISRRHIFQPIKVYYIDEEHFKYEEKKKCLNNLVVGLKCHQTDCGMRKIPEIHFSTFMLNAKAAGVGEFPWHVHLKCKNFICGGALISDVWVLTAGHCVIVDKLLEPKDCMAYLGSIYLQDSNWHVHSVKEIFLHEGYVDYPLKRDIALLKLSQPVTYTNYIQPICLPHKRFVEKDYLHCVSAGFGKTIRDRSSDTLLKVRMKQRNQTAGISSLCIGNEYSNICMGDSGGPFVCRNKLNRWEVVGVNSFVRYDDRNVTEKTIESKKCQMSFVERVHYYLKWIKRKTKTEF